MPLKLNLGAGETRIDGYLSVDRKINGGEVYPLCIADEECDEVRASHILEHFSHKDVLNVLREWVRVLRPGGWLRVAVPDFSWICERFVEPETTPVQRSMLQMYVMGAHADVNDRHGSVFDEDALKDALEHVGLTHIRRWKSEISDCASLPVSLNLMGQKPLGDGEEEPVAESDDPTHEIVDQDGSPLADPYLRDHPDLRFHGIEIPKGSVYAVQTVPRLGFTSHFHCALQAYSRLGIPLVMSGGVFWNQGLERCFETAIAAGVKYIIASDFDTIFDERDIEVLYGIMEAREDIDALVPVQMRREVASALLTMKDSDGNVRMNVTRDDFADDVTPIATGHFGLTILRASSVATMAKPWFAEKPDESGGWSEGRVDADIAFWGQLEASGFKAYLANRVVVGHMEVVVTYPDTDLKPLVQRASENYKDNRPSRLESKIWR
jgi:predicted SAM-dependent methyltransferase